MMKRENVKHSLLTVIAVCGIAALLSACSLLPQSAEETTETTAPTTTETTTVTTTEDESTTFPETETRKIYTGLEKDAEGSYPYEIATYTTHYHSSDKTRTANLRAAAEKINNIVIPDGAVFSFNQTVGKRTITAGYQTAKVIKDGDFVDGLGGGVCQVSSTVFECVLRANVKIVARSNHTLKIGYVPLGGDATVQWNSRDFQFKNTTGSDLRLTMKCENGRLTCTTSAKDDIDVGNVKISIYKSGKSYVLTRTVNGTQNYRTVSRYKTAKSS